MTDYIKEPQRDIELVFDGDVVVAGGGPSGFAAAIAAARAGAKTLLVERYGFLGGMATAGLVGPIYSLCANGTDKPIVGGVGRDLVERLSAIGGAPSWAQCCKKGVINFDAELLKIALDDLVAAEPNLEVLLHTFCTGVLAEQGRVKTVFLESKSGRWAVRARQYVDATGDADIAFRAGAPAQCGRPEDGLPMAMGSTFHFGGLRPVSPEERAAGVEIIRQGREAGRIRVYSTSRGGAGSVLHAGTASINATRFPGDCTNVRVLTAGEMALRRDTLAIVGYFKDHVPGFENCYLKALPASIGLRESRRITGDYTLTGAEVVAGAQFEDQVALNSWWIDIHCPLGRMDPNGVHICRADCPAEPKCVMLEKHADKLPRELHVPPGGANGIPYRCLLPQGMDNLLVAGRCISADHHGTACIRIMSTCMSTGQAAGVAAARAASDNIPARRVDAAWLRGALRDMGGVVDLP